MVAAAKDGFELASAKQIELEAKFEVGKTTAEKARRRALALIEGNSGE